MKKKLRKAYRLSKGKPQLHYIPGRVMRALAPVFEYGAIKYNDFNYKRGAGLPDVSFIDSCLRHVEDYNDGVDLDVESGLNNIDMAIVNLMMLRDVQLSGKGKDYRFRE